MKKEITIPREWFEKLLEISEWIEISQNERKEEWINYLLGYIESSKNLIKE